MKHPPWHVLSQICSSYLKKSSWIEFSKSFFSVWRSFDKISLVVFEFYSTNNSKNIDNSDTTSELSQSAKMCLSKLPSRHLFVLSQQWKHQNKVQNMFKFNNNFCQWRRSGVFIVHFEHISHIVLVFPSLVLNNLIPVG